MIQEIELRLALEIIGGVLITGIGFIIGYWQGAMHVLNKKGEYQ